MTKENEIQLLNLLNEIRQDENYKDRYRYIGELYSEVLELRQNVNFLKQAINEQKEKNEKLFNKLVWLGKKFQEYKEAQE